MAIPILSAQAMRAWEEDSWRNGVTPEHVITHVGAHLARRVEELTAPGALVLLLAGKGNNGADTLACTAHLRNRRVEVLRLEDPAAQRSAVTTALQNQPELIVDGLFGLGLNRQLSSDWQELIRTINRANVPVLSVDMPSGLNADTGEPFGEAIRARVTLTVGVPKQGLVEMPAAEYVGRLEVAREVGLIDLPGDAEMLWSEPKDFRNFPPARSMQSHKGTYGHVGIVAGSVGYHGASVLAARAAQRARPGLVTLFCQEATYVPVAAQLQAVMVHPGIEGFAEDRFTGLVIGPGLAAPAVLEPMRALTNGLWRDFQGALLVDASALPWIPAGPFRAEACRVITPHPGEAAKLLGRSTTSVQEDRPAALRRLSEKFGGCWVVLKGHQTLVGRAEGSIFYNGSGNPDLAQGGTGDVLAGYLGGLLAQPTLQSDASRTVRFAVWAHGMAADELSRRRSRWIVEELLDELGSEARTAAP